MPKRTNAFQRLVFLIKQQVADDAEVTESIGPRACAHGDLYTTGAGASEGQSREGALRLDPPWTTLHHSAILL